MEESEKRKERLKAMREAAHGGVSVEPGISGGPSYGLSNPLLESENASATQFQQPSRRFDYYTDPTSAFKGARISSPGHHGARSIGPPYHAAAPTPSYQYPAVRSPAQRMFQPPGAHPRQPYPRSSVDARNFCPPYQYPAFPSPGEAMSQVPGAHPRQSYPQSPMEAPNAWATQQLRHQTPPAGRGNAFTYRPPWNFSQGVNFVRPSFGRGDLPHTVYGQGMDLRYRPGSFDSSGRGRGRLLGNTSRNQVLSAKERPDLYCNRSMVEDPWENMTPVLWKGPTPGNDGSWMPKSISAKKAKVSPESSKASFSQGSLAQYLAEAFNDSTNEAFDD